MFESYLGCPWNVLGGTLVERLCLYVEIGPECLDELAMLLGCPFDTLIAPITHVHAESGQSEFEWHGG